MPKDESVNESTTALSDEEKLERARRKAHEGRKLGAELARNLNASVLRKERERQDKIQAIDPDSEIQPASKPEK